MEDGVREEGNSHESSNQEKVMAKVEAMLISEVEKLESLLVDKANIYRSIKKDEERLLDAVKMIVEKVRDMKLEEKRKLKYLISDVVEDVGNINRQIEVSNPIFKYSMLRDITTISQGFHRLLQIDGVGEGDGDEDEDVVGLEEVVKSLLHMSPSIICIVGFDGFGKTTLAKQLYNHTDVVKKSNPRVWVNCLNIFGRKELLINLIRQVASSQPKDLEKMDGQGLQSMLHQQLMGKQYFIVLDNCWRELYLEFVQQSLPRKGYESKLLVTQTEDRYGPYHRHYYTYKMRPLDEGNSWKILLKTMFPVACAHEFPKKLERRGKRMLMKHTGGVPLAIKDVGKEWAQKRMSGSEWEEVIESQDLELRASLGAIESCFYHCLAPIMKSCFHYIGLFKEGTTIKLEKFRQTWFASRGTPLSGYEDMGYINYFRTRNIFRTDNKGLRKYCEVEAIFHKLSIKKVKEGNNGDSHHVIDCSRERVNYPTDQDERLISLFFHGGGCFDASPSYWKCFEQLRVLDFEGFGLKFIPVTIGELIELRYLGLRNNYIQQLPHSLDCLKKLEVLDIALNFMVEVPDIIWEMEALVHLYMSDIFCRKPLKIEALKNLKALTYISVDNWTYEVSGLQMMTSLRKLGIAEVNENSNVSKLFASLVALKNMDCLVLRGSRFRSMPSLDKLGALRRVYKLKLDGLITMLPKAENFPPSLGYLALVNNYFDEDPMPVLEQLSELVTLKLKNAYTGRRMLMSEGGFPNLRSLYISELRNLRNIQFGRRVLSQFDILEITSCPCLQSHHDW